MVRKIYLNYAKAVKENLLVSREEVIKKYNDNSRFSMDKYKLVTGMPILINIEGHYIEANSLPLLTRQNLNEYMLSLRTGKQTEDLFIFKWSVFTK